MKSLSRIGKVKSRRLSPAALLSLGSICPAPISPVGAGASHFHMEKQRKGIAKS